MVVTVKQYNSFKELLSELLIVGKKLLDEKNRVKALVERYREKALAEEKLTRILKDFINQDLLRDNSLDIGCSKLYLAPSPGTRYRLLKKYYDELENQYRNIMRLTSVLEKFSNINADAKITVLFNKGFPVDIIVDL